MSRHRRLSRFKTQKHRANEAKIEHRLRNYDPHWQTAGDMYPCWCHGRWFFPHSWRGLIKR